MNTSYLQTQRAAHLATFPARTPQNARLPLSECLDTDVRALKRAGALDDVITERAAVEELARLYLLTSKQAWTYWIRSCAAAGM
jgi:hypothetical protein